MKIKHFGRIYWRKDEIPTESQLPMVIRLGIADMLFTPEDKDDLHPFEISVKHSNVTQALF